MAYKLMVRKQTFCDPHTYGLIACNLNGDYIGDVSEAKLFDQRGIEPEKRSPDHSICSIGFCQAEQKWYGWSHRASYGFGIGDECKLGDIAFSPSNWDEFVQNMVNFWGSEYHVDFTTERVIVSDRVVLRLGWTYTNDVPNEAIRGTTSSCDFAVPEVWGRGAWVATSLEDARQMAIDYADGVS